MKRFIAGLTALVFLVSFIAVAEARYFDPSTGRFISEDPVGFAGGDVNLYSYATNNPFSFVDPLGKTGFYINGSGSPFVIPDNDAVYKLIQNAFTSARPAGESSDRTDPCHSAAANPLVKAEAIKSGQYFVIPSERYFGYSFLLQAAGTFNGQPGVYEYIVPININLFSGNPILTHQTFVPNAPVSGVPNNWKGEVPPFGGN